MKWFRQMMLESPKQKNQSELLADAIIRSLKERPQDWLFDNYYAYKGGHTTERGIVGEKLRLWTENRPYADITLYNTKIGNRWQRQEIRDLMDDIKRRRVFEEFENEQK